jgi:diaminohydroxyphosphoribosylaminopyrimidine deaminase/5-amino-6-(5-phosphoribosylamino)uracil reductase
MSEEEGKTQEALMREALDLARRGAGKVHPNPLVGAVLVRGDAVIGRGWHAKCGGPHAEVNAIRDARDAGHEDLSDATLYVTLEPCCHTGRTPPCTELIIKTGIRTVVCAMLDPNPLVGGKGIARLRAEGLTVIDGILESESRALNRAFIKYITTKKPFILLKSAMSLDGKIATSTGESQWISCPDSRADVHRLRSEFTAVMTGIGTVLADDPLLTARTGEAETAQPIRVIADSRLRIPLDSRIAKSAREARTIVAVCAETLAQDHSGEIASKAAALKEAGIEILPIREQDGRLDLADLTAQLGKMEIDSILLEAGGTLAEGALKAGIVDRARFYVAPMLIGGERAKSAIAGKGVAALPEAWSLRALTVERSGVDLVVEGDICLPE